MYLPNTVYNIIKEKETVIAQLHQVYNVICSFDYAMLDQSDINYR